MNAASPKTSGSGKRRTLQHLRSMPKSPLLIRYRAARERTGKAHVPFIPLSYFSLSAWWEALRPYARDVFLRRCRFPAAAGPTYSMYSLGNVNGSGAQTATIAMTGDWGTGTDEADRVSQSMAIKVSDDDGRPDYTIHLGDIYYIGDNDSIDQNCLGVRTPAGNPFDPVYWHPGKAGAFALNGDHEMFATGKPYFSRLLPNLGLLNGGNPTGQGVSYFCLKNDHWLVIGLDTGYYGRGIPFLSRLAMKWRWLWKTLPFLLPSCKLHAEQIKWLRDVVRLQDDRDRGIILLTHHQYYSAFEEHYPKAATQLASFIKRPVLWFWGHEHRMAGYHLQGPDTIQAYGRCIGHGGMPVERSDNPPDPRKVAFLDNRVYSPDDNFGWNGYARLNFENEKLTVKYFDIGSIHPRGKDRLLIEETWSAGDQGKLKVEIHQRHEEEDFYGPQNWGGPKQPEKALVDLHAHYPMHLAENIVAGYRAWMINPRRSSSVRARLRAFRATRLHRTGFWADLYALGLLLLNYLNCRKNFPFKNEPAVTIPNLVAGGAKIVLSVLYVPFDEMDLTKEYAAPPEDAYFDDLQEQMFAVEADIATNFAAQAIVAHNREELDQALRSGKMALIHAVEGGFHLGGSTDKVRDNVQKLAKLGVAYITVAHLFFRRVATNSPALPFLCDSAYRLLFREPRRGLTELGKAAVEAMVKNHILIDLTHSSEAAIDEILNLLDQVDPTNETPVLASHGAYRFGKSEYNLIPRHIQKIANRNGVIGLIMCDHWATDGIRGRTETLEQSLEVLCRHIDKIAELTKGYKHIAIGTDLDGFIKPMLKGLEFPRGLNAVRVHIEKHYGHPAARDIFRDNALRLLSHWGTKSCDPPAPLANSAEV